MADESEAREKSEKSVKVKSVKSIVKSKVSSSTTNSVVLKLAEAEAEMEQNKVLRRKRIQKEEWERKRLELELEQKRLEEEEREECTRIKFETLQKYMSEQELGSDDPDAVEEEDGRGSIVSDNAVLDDKSGQIPRNETWFEERPCASGDGDSKGTKWFDGKAGVLELLVENSAPEVVLEKFSGNFLDFPLFIRRFESEVEIKVRSESGKLNRLLSLTKGTLAYDIIEPCIYLDTGYTEAKKRLRKEYEDDNKVSLAYEKRVREWPDIQNGPDIRSFFLFLNKVKCSMNQPEFAIELNSQSNLRVLVSKLPKYIQHRWNREATTSYEKKMKKPDFQMFLDFLDMESLVANNPTYGSEQKPKKTVSNFAVRQQGSSPAHKCVYCGMANHDLDNCYKFRGIPVSDRLKFIQDHGLCFGCVRSTTHRAKECKARLKCSICQKLHATCIHNDGKFVKVSSDARSVNSKENPKEESQSKPSCGATNLSSRLGENTSIAMSCVLVELSNPTTKKCLPVYCFLDSMSNTSFITSDVYDHVMDGSDSGSIQDEVVNLSTLSKTESQTFKTVQGLKVRDIHRSVEANLPKLYKVDKLPVDGNDIMFKSEIESWPHLRHLSKDIPSHDENVPIGLLIGNDAPRLLEPHDVAKPDPKSERSPYAVKYLLGWSGAGPNRGRKENSKVMYVKVKAVTETGSSIVDTKVRNDGEEEIKSMLMDMYERDFVELETHKPARSKEDEKFMDTLERETKLVDGRYVMPLPFRNESDLELPDNRSQAFNAALRLQKRLKLPKNDQLKGKYVSFMNELLAEGQASRVPPEKVSSVTGFENHCFLNYHDVKHPQKPDKFRVVFNAAKEFDGQCLNMHLLQGPTSELMNSQTGVLMRFRTENVAFTADIKGMFNQTRVVEEHRKFLRFYWWDNKELEGDPVEFEMNVHLFGAASSPACSMYALRRTALDHRDDFSEEAIRTVLRDFYVDDVLKSIPDAETARKLTIELCHLLEKGGFVLTKFQSCDADALSSLPLDKVASNTASIDLQDKEVGSLNARVGALGLQWNIVNDTFEFRIVVKDRPFTRRGLLSSLSSVYDPLGFAAPFLLPGRRMLQELSKSKYGWDDILDSDIIEKWIKWRDGLKDLEKIQVNRCVKPKDFGEVKVVQLHGFSDASEYGYGAAVYLRLENDRGDVHVSLVFGKSRVVPLSGETIPRSELVAAVLLAELMSMTEKELEYENVQKFLWTDSEIVLAYLANRKSRFKAFVSNRVRKCLELSKLEDWNYVPTNDNPADHASRGLSPAKVDIDHIWFRGPGFLWQSMSLWPSKSRDERFTVDGNDPEIKKEKKILTVNTESGLENDPVLKMIKNQSDWFAMRRRIASVIVMLENKGKVSEIRVEHLQRAEEKILFRVQKHYFGADYELLSKGKDLCQNSPLAKLNAFIDPSGLLRVGGRATEADIDWKIKHPIIIPKFCHIADVIVLSCHEAVNHGGRAATLNELRSRGLWIIHANSKVKHVIHKCVRCKIIRGKFGEQKMAPLPKDRVAFDAPPMSYCGVDVFGPFITKNGRKEEKRYCALFTDLVYRGIHIEVLNNIDSDSFICGLRRFIARRGNIRLLRSDNGSNFVGARNEIQKALEEMEPDLRKFLLENGADLEWKLNTPNASHHGGVWERQIATARRVLESVLNKHHGLLNDQSFITLMAEVEAIVNCRPLTTETLGDPDSVIPLSPFNLLTQKFKVVLPPPGNFDDRAELYTRNHWRRIQHLTNEIWSRYRKEYLAQLQSYTKWTKSRRNFQIDDVVLVRDDSLHRNHWPLGRVSETYPDHAGRVRSVKIRMARDNLKNEPKFLCRPISKLVLLLEH